ncbi:MAG: DUF4390 domain-containing protein [Chromatiales bacterium]
MRAEEFLVEEASTHLQDGVYLLDAEIDYRLSDTAIEALDNGVPLTMEVHLQVRGKHAWIWQSDAAEYRLRNVIRYHALSGLYEVTGLASDTRRNFVSRDAALGALGEIDDFPLIERDRLEPDETYEVALKAELDIEALPLPLRPLAYLSSAWKLSSEWTSWRLKP